ncbi:hypothetical protein BSKO_02274 [Bryopsis sp. KO-2023]|nr:hypothetical protein BSKO_02274 [Bryopsis sp. KO-2023]
MALPFLREQQQSCRMWHMLNRGSADVHEASEFQGNQASATYRSHPSTMTLMESQEAMINDMVEQVIEMRAYVHTMRERPASPPPILNFRNIRERRIRAHNKLVNASGGDPPLYWLLQRHRES